VAANGPYFNPDTPSLFSFTDVDLSQVTFSQAADDPGSLERNSLVIDIAGTSPGRVEITDEFGIPGSPHVGDGVITSFSFAGGTTISLAQIEQELITIDESDDADYVQGFAGDDTIQGGKGDDILDGMGGNNTFVWSPGDGNDQIANTGSGGTNKLVLHGVSSADVSITVDPTNSANADVVIGREKIALVDQFGFYHDVISSIVFDDGTTWASTT